MRRLVVLSTAGVLMVFVGLASSAPASPGTISKQQVRALVNRLDEATATGDIDSLARYLDKDFIFRMRVPAEDVSYRLGPVKYLRRLKQGYEMVKDYSTQRSDIGIAIGPEGHSAVSNSRLLELLTIDEKRISTVSIQNIHFQLKGGKLTVTSISAIQEDRKQNSVNIL